MPNHDWGQHLKLDTRTFKGTGDLDLKRQTGIKMLKSKGLAHVSENLMKETVAVDSLFQLEHFQLQKLNCSHLMPWRSLSSCQGEAGGRGPPELVRSLKMS